jgi:hypothetical protein
LALAANSQLVRALTRFGSFKEMKSKIRGLIPIFFAVIFWIILHLPGVEWLERLIEGADLLLLLLGLLSLLDQKGHSQQTRKSQVA